jgi:hypothetical protein
MEKMKEREREANKDEMGKELHKAFLIFSVDSLSLFFF